MKQLKALPWLSLIGVLILSGCGGETSTASTPGKTLMSQVGNVEANLSNAGGIQGVVSFQGTAPEPALSALRSFSECSVLHSGNVYSNRILIQDGKLQNVFVYVKSGLENYSFEAPTTPVLLDQKGCIYDPHVLGIQVNQAFHIKNSDVSLHNVHSKSVNQKKFNIGMPVQGMVLKRKFTTPEVMIPLTCDVHPWMKSYVGVLGHPYFSVTAADGSFSIPNLPPGNYTLEAWHEAYGTRSTKITISPGQTSPANFSFQAA